MGIELEKYEYYIRPGMTDMRKGAHSLALIAQDGMRLTPFSKSVFVFCGCNGKTVKAIVWDRNGWLMATKRLECKGRHKWPMDEAEARKVSLGEIIETLRGGDPWKRLPELSPRHV